MHVTLPDMADPQVVSFKTQKDWAKWLAKHHDTCEEGVWLRMYKKATKIPSVDYPQALEEALCYGWIDGQKKSYDAESWIQKFTPRRKRSPWSKINIGHVERLTKEGRMQPTGVAQVEAAKADGRWEQAYSSASTMEMPEDFLRELKKDKKAYAFFQKLNKANLYAIFYRLTTAKKPETVEKRKKDILAMLARGEAIHVMKKL